MAGKMNMARIIWYGKYIMSSTDMKAQPGGQKEGFAICMDGKCVWIVVVVQWVDQECGVLA